VAKATPRPVTKPGYEELTTTGRRACRDGLFGSLLSDVNAPAIGLE
jgi:hypothetical protein